MSLAHVLLSLLFQAAPCSILISLTQIDIGVAPAAPVARSSRSRLSAVVQGACGAAGHLAEVVTTSFDATGSAEHVNDSGGGCFDFLKKSAGTGVNTRLRHRRRRRRNRSAKPASGMLPGEAAKVRVLTMKKSRSFLLGAFFRGHICMGQVCSGCWSAFGVDCCAQEGTSKITPWFGAPVIVRGASTGGGGGGGRAALLSG